MFKTTIRGYEVFCESTQEILALVLAAASTPAPKTTSTRPTTPRATTGKRKKKVTAAAKKARAKKARESYKAKQDAKKAAAAPTTAETHHGSAPTKQPRADTSGEVIAVLRRSGLALTITEIRDDLQKAGWKYTGTDPKGTIRATLARLVGKGIIARGSNNGDATFTIARVEHADPLPHQQRESDV